MTDFVFNIAKGAVSEKVRDDPTKIGVLLLKVAEADAAMKDRATLAAVVANSTEANFTGYARKTPLTEALTVDNVADLTYVTLPDQAWTPAGGATNNNLVKLVTYYDEGGTDATRVPLTAHDFVATTDGSTLTATMPVGGFFTAS